MWDYRGLFSGEPKDRVPKTVHEQCLSCAAGPCSASRKPCEVQLRTSKRLSRFVMPHDQTTVGLDVYDLCVFKKKASSIGALQVLDAVLSIHLPSWTMLTGAGRTLQWSSLDCAHSLGNWRFSRSDLVRPLLTIYM